MSDEVKVKTVWVARDKESSDLSAKDTQVMYVIASKRKLLTMSNNGYYGMGEEDVADIPPVLWKAMGGPELEPGAAPIKMEIAIAGPVKRG